MKTRWRETAIFTLPSSGLALGRRAAVGGTEAVGRLNESDSVPAIHARWIAASIGSTPPALWPRPLGKGSGTCSQRTHPSSLICSLRVSASGTLMEQERAAKQTQFGESSKTVCAACKPISSISTRSIGPNRMRISRKCGRRSWRASRRKVRFAISGFPTSVFRR